MAPALLLAAYIALSPVGADLISVPLAATDPVTYRIAYYRNEETDYGKYDITHDPELIAPSIAANAAIVIDVPTGAVLWHKNAYKPLPIASITKMMSVLVALEEIEELDRLVTFSELAADKEGSRIGVDAGEQFTARDLIRASLVRSANDAVYALAEDVAGTSQDFVDLMNDKAAFLRLGSTRFANPVGYDNEENFSTAYEVTIIARELLKYPDIRSITANQEIVIYNTAGEDYILKSTNQLLDSYLNIYGLKTGTTELAGQSLVALGEIDDGREIMVVVLNAEDRFQEAKVVFDWTERAFDFPKQ